MKYQYPILILLLLSLLFLSVPASGYSPDAVTLYEQGTASVAAGNLSDAITAFDQALLLEPEYYEAWDARADALNRDGQFSSALESSSRALAVNSSYLPGWINRGQILYNLGYVYEDQIKDPVKANEYYLEQVQAFEKAIVLDPTNADAWFNKAYALAGLKRYDEAIAAFDKVKELNPAYPKIDKNREIARQLRDSVTPFYVTYAPVIIGIAAIIIGILFWVLFLREKED
ncbi:tetratricopeptide repeat protein [Methanoregula sp.]|uniref:tetratricopeptide repeat protein n=1 Tax=Methanoregula sp. TaxID=2052170 RepID=UPI00262B526D|nr:tetratricopeptide repeat protein [Methanoregula sp.]MDD5141885.1 tetratricopeptide repeat protein [Methanoregula sp.]